MSETKIVIIPGDGIGPSIVDATTQVLDKLNCGFEYVYADAGLSAVEKGEELIPQRTLDLIEQHKVALKGPITTPIGKGFTSINVTLRQKFNLYANVRPAVTFPGTRSRYDGIDIITIRENTEGLYSGEGQTVDKVEGRAESLSVITTEGARRILRFAYDLAKKKNRHKITVVHKANILKSTSGLFLDVAREIAKEHMDVESTEMIVDNCCMQLVMNPHQFDMLVTTNLFGDIISDLCAGLVGGLGMAPGANIGDDVAIFEAVHGSAPDIAGKNLANPTSIMLAAAMMLDHLRQTGKAEALRGAIRETISAGDRCTADLGGTGGTTDFTQAVIERL